MNQLNRERTNSAKLVQQQPPIQSGLQCWLDQHPSLRYIAPFAVFIFFLAVSPRLPLPASVEAPLRILVLSAVCYVCWPREISIHPRYGLVSTVIGIGVFLLWIAPDLFFPRYRGTLLFSNSIIGHVHSSIAPDQLRSSWVLAWRTARAVIIVPIVEELFWRAWLMRWLIKSDFQSIPLGAYMPFAFWVTALLFASEHGPYWDVGLVTGVIYNAWMIRSKSVGDCILMHAVTNLALSLYVIATAQWQYWQ